MAGLGSGLSWSRLGWVGLGGAGLIWSEPAWAVLTWAEMGAGLHIPCERLAQQLQLAAQAPTASFRKLLRLLKLLLKHYTIASVFNDQ